MKIRLSWVDAYDRRAIPGNSMVRLSAGGTLALERETGGQKADSAADAQGGAYAHLPEALHLKAPTETQDLSLSATWGRDHGSIQVWCANIGCVPMRRGFLYLVAILGLVQPQVLNWRLSNTLEEDSRLAALREAMQQYTNSLIYNKYQGSEFTNVNFTQVLKVADIKVVKATGLTTS